MMAERVTATVGLLVGALAVALGIVAVAEAPLPSRLRWAMLLGGILGAAAFSARRHLVISRLPAAAIAGIGGIILLGAGALALVDPGNAAAWFGAASGLLGLAIGVLAVADGRRIPPEVVAARVRAVSVGVLLVLAGFLLAGVLVSIPSWLALDLSPVGESASEQLALGMGFVAVTIGFLLGTARGLGYLDVRAPDRRAVAWAVGGIVLVIGTALVLSLLYALIGVDGAEHQLSRRAREEGVAILLVGMPLTLLVTAVGEEVLYRNGIQKYLTEEFTPVVAIVLTSLLFAVAHLPALAAVGPAGITATLSIIFVLSIIIGTIYERTRNLLVPIVVHGCYNVFVFLLWYLDLAA